MIPLIKTLIPAKELLMHRLEEVLYSGYVAQGQAVDDFENEFSKFIGNAHSLSVNSGSSALHVALILAGVTSGDEVISTPITAEPTNTVIKQTGAKIVWADIDPSTGNICPDDVESKITEKTKAIMVVDYAGMPVNINRFQEIEAKYGITVIEDAAHALGASYEGQMLGNHFKYTTFSFQAIKHLTTIDGGMVCIKDKDEYEKAKLIRWFGISKGSTRLENDIKMQGYKYHMNNINATIGLVQLENINSVIDKYIENGRYFDEALKGIDGVELLTYYQNSQPSYWLYTMKVKNRDAFVKMMAYNGIMASELHKRNDAHTIFKESKVNLPNVDNFEKEWVHIPCGWWVTKEDREQIVSVIKKVGRMIPLYKVFMPDNISDGVLEILNSGQLAYGVHARMFEEKLRAFVGNPNILTVSGNSIFFALKLIDIKEGDEVIASPMSCLATNQPIAYAGANVIWADIDPLTGSLDPVDVKKRITPNTKAIIHYHWGGYPGYIDEINTIAKEQGIKVIEDASESFGAEYKGNKLGNTNTDIVCYSFTPVRLPNAIDGGGLAFKDKELYEKACLMRDFGIDRTKFRDDLGEISANCDISTVGDSGTMNNISGYIGSCQMDYTHELYTKQRKNAQKWYEKLADNKNIIPLKLRTETNPSYWTFTILANNRDKLLNDFREKGFYASKMHLRNDLYSVFKSSAKDFKGVNEFSEKQLNLPCGWWFII